MNGIEMGYLFQKGEDWTSGQSLHIQDFVEYIPAPIQNKTFKEKSQM